MNEITSKKIWPLTVSYFGVLAKKIRRDFRNWLFVSGWTFWEKTFVSQNFLLSWIFSDTGQKMFKTLSYFVRQGHRKRNLCVQRYFVTKNKMIQMFQRKVSFYNCFRILIGKVCTFEKKIIVLFLKTLFYVSRGKISEEIFVSKSSFFL